MAIDPAGIVARAMAHVITRMTVVRIAVARFEFTFSTPTLARTAVTPAKTAERSAQATQFIAGCNRIGPRGGKQYQWAAKSRNLGTPQQSIGRSRRIRARSRRARIGTGGQGRDCRQQRRP